MIGRAVAQSGRDPLNAGEVHVWYRFSEGIDADGICLAEGTLSSSERARSQRFRAIHDRRDYVIAHDLLRRTLSRYADVAPAEWEFAAAPGGKPALKYGNRVRVDDRCASLSFSLSHTRGLVACVIADDLPLGVDVERVDHTLELHDLATLCCSSEEMTGLRRSGVIDPDAFFELWTLKEAFVKATGEGVGRSLRALSFTLDARRGIRCVAPSTTEASRWEFALFTPRSGYRLAAAARGAEGSGVSFIARDDDRPLETTTPYRWPHGSARRSLGERHGDRL